MRDGLGMSFTQIAAAVGYGPAAVRRWYYGFCERGYEAFPELNPFEREAKAQELRKKNSRSRKPRRTAQAA